jgi:hypothetical protein
MKSDIKWYCWAAVLVCAALPLPLSITRDPGPGRGVPSTPRRRAIPKPPRAIDPVLVYSTYLGGTSVAAGTPTNTANGPSQSILAYPQGITASYVDSSGNIYVAGATAAADFPVTSGVVQATNTQNNRVGFLSKLDPTGQTLLFSTYLYGFGSVSSIALDVSGNIYVAGIAPATPSGIALQNPTPLPIPPGTTPYNAAARDMSIMKLNSTATAVLNATYFGGSGVGTVTGLAVWNRNRPDARIGRGLGRLQFCESHSGFNGDLRAFDWW